MSRQIKGRWAGYYKYGSEYSLELQDQRFPFTVDIVLENGIVKGTSVDAIVKEHFNEPAQIEGVCENDEIHFIMTYTCLVEVDGNNLTVIVPDKPSAGIFYSGKFKKKFFSNTLSFIGEWNISKSYLSENGEGQYESCGGTWSMTKA